ncbi:MAG: hypothetical protein IIX02_04615 [Clostridia bacterium]|nr:hypothetical protein [Clostridia bacterium]
MAEFASNAKGNAALTTGIIGTAGVGMGLLSNLLGLNNCNGNSESMPINRYEATLQAKISELETSVKLRDANTFTMGEMGKLRDYVDSKFARVEHELCDQKVYNATNTATIGCIANQVNALMALTKLVIPNGSICPGWGNVTVTPATTTA